MNAWRPLRRLIAFGATAGALACSPSEAPEPTPTAISTSTSSSSQEQTNPVVPECTSLNAELVQGPELFMYEFTVTGKNLDQQHVYAPEALVIDFGDGSDRYDSADSGVPYYIPARHQFPALAEGQPSQKYQVNAEIRMNVLDENLAPPALDDALSVTCPVREVEVGVS